MTERTLIRINLDPPQDIARLNGIDDELAVRIVACRKLGTLFIGPEDLTQVEGINLEMAFRMAEEIDWEAPRPARRRFYTARKHRRIKKNWTDAALHSLAALALFWLLAARVLPMLSLATVIGSSGSGWIMAHILGALGLAVLFMLLSSITSAALALSRQPNRAHKSKRVRSAFSLLAVISLLLSLVLSAMMEL